ncbi:MAG TPA: hypothetical protein VHJ34_03160 [Actinomycetota bacterium]|nr:hypothetical protein [Actinomycetota bacterium]
MALHVGTPFAEWCGDPKKWADGFWEHYNLLKHDPEFDPDPLAVKAFQESAYLLLIAELLNRVAQSTVPARRIFSDYRFETLRGWTHETLRTP